MKGNEETPKKSSTDNSSNQQAAKKQGNIIKEGTQDKEKNGKSKLMIKIVPKLRK
jgi:hypothetical protein